MEKVIFSIFFNLNISKKILSSRYMRRIREWYPGAIYHIMARGIRRMEIFQEEMDYQVFLILLKKVLKKNDAKLHAYCLMTNHIHLLLETKTVEVGKIMKELESCYAMNYNHKYGYKGHLFEDRYKSCTVKDDVSAIRRSTEC